MRVRLNNVHLRLRYRDNDEKVEFCFKHNTNERDGHKVALEYNVNISKEQARDFEAVALKMELKQTAVHEKKRTSYRLIENDCICDIDTYPGVPTYVEIEHSNKQVINETINILGLNNFVFSTKSGREFFAMYDIEYYSTLTF